MFMLTLVLYCVFVQLSLLYHWLIVVVPCVLCYIACIYCLQIESHLAYADVNPTHVSFYKSNRLNFASIAICKSRWVDIEVHLHTVTYYVEYLMAVIPSVSFSPWLVRSRQLRIRSTVTLYWCSTSRMFIGGNVLTVLFCCTTSHWNSWRSTGL